MLLAIPPGRDSRLITTADIQQDVQAHGFPEGPPVLGHTLESVEVLLTTSQKASQIMGGEYVSFLADLPVYYLLLKGPFVMENISVPAGEQLPTANQGEEVFDARTGSLLIG